MCDCCGQKTQPQGLPHIHQHGPGHHHDHSHGHDHGHTHDHGHDHNHDDQQRAAQAPVITVIEAKP